MFNWNPAKFSPPPFPNMIGQPLPPTYMHFLEVEYGTDLSAVRVHENHAATHRKGPYSDGNDVYFPPGQYQPHTDAGREVVGDELVTVMKMSKHNGANNAPPGLQTAPSQSNVITGG